MPSASLSSISKRAKTDEGPPVGGLPTPPDPYAAVAMYYSKLNAFRPWSPKGGFPPLPGYPLQHPFNRGVIAEPSGIDVRRPEDINQASLDRITSESPHGSSKRKLGEKGRNIKRNQNLSGFD